MFKPSADLTRHFAMFVNPVTYCALKLTCSAFNTALIREHESYYRARVKHISAFRPLPHIAGFATYKDILDRISELFDYSEDFAAHVRTTDILVEVVLKTPSLLDKLFSTENGPADIVTFLSQFPSCHKCVIHDATIVKQFVETKKRWAKGFIDLICSNFEVFDSFLRSELMMCAVSLAMSELPDDYLHLCAKLRTAFDVDYKYVHRVEHLTAPPFELQQCFEERSDAIYNMLESLKPSTHVLTNLLSSDDTSSVLKEGLLGKEKVESTSQKKSELLFEREGLEKENSRTYI